MDMYLELNSSIECSANKQRNMASLACHFELIAATTTNGRHLRGARNLHAPSKPKSALRHAQVCPESLITRYGMWSSEASIESRDGISDLDDIQTTDKSTSIVQLWKLRREWDIN